MLILRTCRQKIEQLAFSPDNRGFAAVGRSGAYWWPALDGSQGRKLAERTWGRSNLGFDPSGEYLAVSSATTVNLYHLTDGSSRPSLRLHSGIWVAASPTEPVFVFCTQVTAPIEAWRLSADGSVARMWSAKPAGPTSPPVFSPDGTWFVQFEFLGWQAEGHSFRLVVRQPHTGGVIRAVGVRTFPWGVPAISTDGERIAVGHEKHLFICGLAADVPLLADIRNDSLKHFTGVAFHPSGQFLAATSNDTTVKLYDTATWQLARTFTWNVGRLRSVAFSPDGTRAAVGSDTGKVVVWDVDLL
jgi:WD40 repeat protein